jgi:hypothetical protein
MGGSADRQPAPTDRKTAMADDRAHIGRCRVTEEYPTASADFLQ